ncbi:MAG: hypothetical protein M3N21_01745 [Actinomycetota bacterium]|nr:hypothetical protein [Actinomycetota bacterium]
MYVWLWRRFPGGFAGKVFFSTALLTVAVLLLFFVVFPWVEPKLPYSDVTVTTPGVPVPTASRPG